MSDIVSLTQYTTDIEQFTAAADIRREFGRADWKFGPVAAIGTCT
jgi:hypothetical protein